jgi:hypothetical protein
MEKDDIVDTNIYRIVEQVLVAYSILNVHIGVLTKVLIEDITKQLVMDSCEYEGD